MSIYKHKDWPYFTWDKEVLGELLAQVSHRQGRLLGRMESIGFSFREEAGLQTMTMEVIKSNEIEGQILDADQVRSSIARQMGLSVAGLVPSDRNVDGVVQVLLDATQKFKEELTEKRLCGWQAALFPTGHSGMYKIVVGAWRDNSPDDPMQVVSGSMSRPRVHFQAPDAALLPKEMKLFMDWFNSDRETHPILKAAIAHFWFVTIHPYDDGNGRIARTIADLQLARADGSQQRFYSMSSQIRLERNAYYDILEKTQKGGLEITDWMHWFLSCLDRALIAADSTTSRVLQKSKYWEHLASKDLNPRQKEMITRLLDGFNSKLTTSKWANVAKCSQDTALRDIQELIKQEVLEKEESGGRSTAYRLKGMVSG
jgi:Fic family protein